MFTNTHLYGPRRNVPKPYIPYRAGYAAGPPSRIGPELTRTRTKPAGGALDRAARRKREVSIMSYDLLIKNGTVVDGTGSARRVGQVAITGRGIAGIRQIKG